MFIFSSIGDMLDSLSLLSSVFCGRPDLDGSRFPNCSIGGALLLLLISAPNPSFALSAMGFTTVGPDAIEVWVSWPTIGRTLSWLRLTSLVETMIPASASGGMKELNWAP